MLWIVPRSSNAKRTNSTYNKHTETLTHILFAFQTKFLHRWVWMWTSWTQIKTYTMTHNHRTINIQLLSHKHHRMICVIECKCNWTKLITLRFISFDVISCSSLAWLTSSCACAEITQDVNKHVSYSNLNQTWWRKTATNTKHHTTDLMCAQGTYQTHTHAHTHTLIVSLVHIKSIKPFGSINKYSQVQPFLFLNLKVNNIPPVCVWGEGVTLSQTGRDTKDWKSW